MRDDCLCHGSAVWSVLFAINTCFFSNLCLFVSKLFLSIKNTNTSKTMGFQVIYYCCRLHLRIFMLQKRKKKTGGKKNIVCLFFNAQSTHIAPQMVQVYTMQLNFCSSVFESDSGTFIAANQTHINDRCWLR